MNRVLCLLLLCGVTTTIFAQSNEAKPTKVWTLKQCVDYALANNLDVQRSQYGVETAEINRLQSKMAMVPSLNGSISNGFNWGRSINPVTNLFTTQEVRSLSPGANSSVTLFNGMRIQNTIKQSTKDLQASEMDLEKAKNDVSLNVVTLYINVIFNKELLEVAKFQLSSSQQQLERTKKQVAAGALAKSNELNLDAQVASNELNVINGENALSLSLLQLKQALQLPASESLDVETPEVNVEDFVLDQTSQEIFEIAKETMPEMKSAQLRVRSALYSMRATKGNMYPRLSFNASVNSNYSSANDRPQFISDPNATPERSPDPLPLVFFDPSGTTQIPAVAYQLNQPGTYTDGYGQIDQLQDNIFRSVNLSLTIPVFNGLQAKSAVKRAVINQQLTEISAKQVHQTLRQNVETAFNDAVAASKSYNASTRQVQSREEAFRMTQQRYDIGAANYVEYQVAENDLFQAKSDLTRAKYNFIFRKKLLDFYQGKPLGF